MNIRDSAFAEFAVCCGIAVVAFPMCIWVFSYGRYRAPQDDLAGCVFFIMLLLTAAGIWRSFHLVSKRPRWVALCGLLFFPVWGFILLLTLCLGGR